MTNSIKPSRFVGLHAHSTVGSIGDAIGLPQEHMDFAVSNNMDALALTDHGSMAGVSHQQIHAKKLKDKGVKFKAIPGVEAYFIDSLSEWSKLVQIQKANKALSKAISIGNEMSETEAEMDTKHGKQSSEEEEGGTVVEIESETKNNKFSDPIAQRNHIVLLPKNNVGLKSIFQMVSESYIDGFYRYPRVDMNILKRHAKGNIIASSACIGGRLARTIFDNQDQTLEWRNWGVNRHNYNKIMTELKSITEQFVDALGGPENYYLELQFNRLSAQHLVNFYLMELARETGLKLVVTVDSHYSNPNHWREREVYKAMAWASKTKGTIDPNTLPQTVEELKCELYPKNADQLWNTYLKEKSEYPDLYTDDQIICDAIERTHDIAHQLIGDVSVDRSVKLPGIGRLIEKNALEKLLEANEGMSEDDVAFKQLVQLAINGLRNVGRNHDEVYINRLKNELDTIKHLKFAKYFLTYHKIMDIAGKEMLIGNGRGSAAGSLLSYVLNITQVDPIRFGLLWERFLVRSKKGYPDIDSDFSDRDRAVKLLIEFFGSENVIPVTNFAQLQLRSLIKDVARLHNLPFEEINAATGKIEKEVLDIAKQVEGFDRGTWVLTFEAAMNDSPTFQELMEKHPEFESTIKVLFKQMRGLSRHAGGVIITENSREGMPLIKAGGELQTPWPEGVNFRHLEEFGLLKFDILGLGTLRMFEQCVRRILKKNGVKNPTFRQIKQWFWDNLHPDNNPMTDIKVFENVFWNGNYTGIFQFINDKTQNFMRQMKPKSVTDIAVATSIFRPGPLSLKVDQRFLNNRANPESVVYKHPLLREVFAETSGLLVFQEQLQMIYHKLAGVPLEDTDGIRKAFTKKEINNKEKAQAERNKLRQSFIEACGKANNIDPEDCGDIFDEMEKLVAYSFNKSHAVCYAITTWQCAWFLTYYPDEWVATYIDYCAISKGKVTGKEDPKAIAIKEAKALGYELTKPDINVSEYEFAVHPTKAKTLVPSFSSLQHVGKTAVSEIQQFRPYTSVKDLLVNPDGSWRHSKFNKSALSTLVKLEALGSMDIVGEDKLFKNYKQVYAVVVEKNDLFKRITSRKKNNDITAELEAAIAEVQDMEDWTKAEKLEFTKDLAGAVDFDLLLSKDAREKLDELGFESIDNWSEKGNYWAIVASAGLAKTKTGKTYLKLRLFAEANKEVTCFIWGWKGEVNLVQNDVIVGLFDKSDFGFSAYQNKIYKIN